MIYMVAYKVFLQFFLVSPYWFNGNQVYVVCCSANLARIETHVGAYIQYPPLWVDYEISCRLIAVLHKYLWKEQVESPVSATHLGISRPLRNFSTGASGMGFPRNSLIVPRISSSQFLRCGIA